MCVCVGAQNPEGRQLLLEAVALVGALLLSLDRRIDGAVRERSVVAYYRLKGGAQAWAPPPSNSLAARGPGCIVQLPSWPTRLYHLRNFVKSLKQHGIASAQSCPVAIAI